MAPNAAYVLNPSNASDGYGDWDEDGMNNLEEYQVALAEDLGRGYSSECVTLHPRPSPNRLA